MTTPLYISTVLWIAITCFQSWTIRSLTRRMDYTDDLQYVTLDMIKHVEQTVAHHIDRQKR